MALQTSGAISINNIKGELSSTSNSLRALSAAAGFSTPDAMSEFYGYASFNPRDHFNVLTATGNGGSLTMSGTNFSPQAGFHLQGNGNTSYMSNVLQHVKGHGIDYGNGTDSGTTFLNGKIDYNSNGVTISHNYSFDINDSGLTQRAMLFGNMTQYTTGGITTLTNKEAGFGFIKTQSVPSYINNWYHHLDSKPYFIIFYGKYGTTSIFGPTTSYDYETNPTPSYVASDGTVYKWRGYFGPHITNNPYFQNSMFKTVDSSKFVTNDSAWRYITVTSDTSNFNFGFYAHPVENFSYTGVINFGEGSCRGIQYQTVNIGAQPKFVILLPTWATNPPDFYPCLKTEDMDTNESAEFGSRGYSNNNGFPITLSSTGFTVGNQYIGDINRTCSQHVIKMFYYAII